MLIVEKNQRKDCVGLETIRFKIQVYDKSRLESVLNLGQFYALESQI